MRRYIGDAKYGKLVGTDQFGNKYYENTTYGEEVPGGCLALFRESDGRRSSCSSEGCRYGSHRKRNGRLKAKAKRMVSPPPVCFLLPPPSQTKKVKIVTIVMPLSITA